MKESKADQLAQRMVDLAVGPQFLVPAEERLN
jgi:hypothetical protein